MNTKKTILLLLMFFSIYLSFSQIDNKKPFQIVPYVGLSSPQGDFKDFSDNGSVFGLSIDKYISSKFALGLDFNYQSNAFINPFNYSSIPSAYNVVNNDDGKWNTTSLTFGPTYKIGSKKFTAELYTKAGILYVKSPNANSNFQYSAGNKDLFYLPEQKRTGFGLTSGIRLNYQVSKSVSLFFNPQYVYGSAKVEYCDCGIEGLSSPDEILEQQPIKKTFNPSYLNLNFGLAFKLDGIDKTSNENQASINRNLPICDISFVELECSATNPILQLSMFWSGFDPNFTRTVEIFNGSTLINPTNSSPQALSQNYGNIPFYSPITSNLIGVSLDATIKIFDTNGNVVCTKSINFTVPQCSPQPPSCTFDLDINNAICDSNTITYNTTGAWSNLTIGSIIEIEAKTQSGSIIPISVLPSNLINVTAANTTGNTSNTVSIPSSFNGTPISILMKISEPTTGFEKFCGMSDLMIPECEPLSTDCDWEYTITCDPKNNGIKIHVSSTWNNVPAGSTLRYKLVDLNGGANIPFTSTPNNLPQSITTNGSSSHTFYINSSFSGAQASFKMEIVDANEVVLCRNGVDMKIPKCIFKSCEPELISASCINDIPTINFSVPWANFNQFANLFVFADIYDSNQTLIQSLSRPLTTINGTAQFNNISLPPQYAGTTIYIQTRICKIGEPAKNCDCLKKLIIDVPICCDICDGISITDNTDPNQKGEGWLFKLLWSIAPITTTPVDKISLTLESFGANNSTPNQVLPSPNFEISGAGILTPTIAYNANPIGSLNGKRSNFWVIDFSPNPFTGGDLVTVIERYDRKTLKNYRIKVTLYKTDGTYCIQYLNFNN